MTKIEQVRLILAASYLKRDYALFVLDNEDDTDVLSYEGVTPNNVRWLFKSDFCTLIVFLGDGTW